MAISCNYTHDSPQVTFSAKDPKITYVVKVYGAGDDFIAAASAAWYFVPDNVGSMWKFDGSIDPFEETEGSNAIYLAKINLTRQGSQETAQSPFGTGATPQPDLQFDTTGGTQRIHNSISTNAYGVGAPDFSGAIGVRDKAVEGVDVPSPKLKWSETHYFDPKKITNAFVDKLVASTGKTNSAAWRIFEAEEVMFHGVTGKRQGRELVPITYNFEASPNRTGLTVGGIGGITKKGWHYLDPYYETREDATNKSLIQTATAVYVHKVAETVDFNTLGVPSNAFVVN